MCVLVRIDAKCSLRARPRRANDADGKLEPDQKPDDDHRRDAPAHPACARWCGSLHCDGNGYHAEKHRRHGEICFAPEDIGGVVHGDEWQAESHGDDEQEADQESEHVVWTFWLIRDEKMSNTHIAVGATRSTTNFRGGDDGIRTRGLDLDRVAC